MSSDSSSSDEESSRLKEALDTSFLKDDLYRNGKCTPEKSIEQSKLLQSLRHQNHQDITANPFSIKVTPEFQQHVSRHLSKLLDKRIDDTEVFLQVKNKKKPSNTGIKLLFSSKKYLKSSVFTEICGRSKKYTRKINGKEIDFEARAKEVAVSSEWILSKEEVKSWAPSWKNNVEVLKLDEQKSKKKKK